MQAARTRTSGLPGLCTAAALALAVLWPVQAHALFGDTPSLKQALKALPGLIRALKGASGNPEPGVLLGGPIFTVQEHDARSLGADGICIDVKEAVALAASFRTRPD